MELLLSEHGETLLYAIVGTIVIVMICSICCENWRKITPDYKNTLSRNSAEFIEQNKGKYPTIEVDEVIYTDYQNKEFNFRDYITAKDCDGNDITKDMNV